MILAIGGLKGGSGKTTTAVNLAVMRAQEVDGLLLVDCDPQRTSSDFTLRRGRRHGAAGFRCAVLESGSPERELDELAASHAEMIIDAGPQNDAAQDAALGIADCFLSPFAPRSFDVWTRDRVARMVERAREANPRLLAYCFLNRADPRGPENEAAAEALRGDVLELLPACLVNRKAYARSAALGDAVIEHRPADPLAIAEIEELYRCVYAAK